MLASLIPSAEEQVAPCRTHRGRSRPVQLYVVGQGASSGLTLGTRDAERALMKVCMHAGTRQPTEKCRGMRQWRRRERRWQGQSMQPHGTQEGTSADSGTCRVCGVPPAGAVAATVSPPQCLRFALASSPYEV